MITLTASPDPRTGSVTLTLDDATGVTGIVRADINGTRPVRLRADELPATGRASFTDWEPALAGRIQYRLTGAAGDVWTEVAGELPRFNIPSIPQFAETVDTVHGYAAGRSSSAIFHQVINRSDPLVAEGRLRPRVGRLDCWLESYQDARDLENVLERGKVILYRQAEHPGMDMYFHASDVTIEPDESAWKLSLSYVEVEFPAGNVISQKGWTFTGLAAANTDFEAIAKNYGSFVDVAIGEKG